MSFYAQPQLNWEKSYVRKQLQLHKQETVTNNVTIQLVVVLTRFIRKMFKIYYVISYHSDNEHSNNYIIMN